MERVRLSLQDRLAEAVRRYSRPADYSTPYCLPSHRMASSKKTWGMPLFDRNLGNIVAAQRNMERVRLSLQNRLAEVFRRYANAGQQVEKYRGTILPDAKETLDLVASAYPQGEFSYLNLLTAQRTYSQSNLAYLESLLQLKLAQGQIEGLLLNESLSGSSGQLRETRVSPECPDGFHRSHIAELTLAVRGHLS